MTALPWPTGGFAGWHAFAAELQARMSLIQRTIEPDWRYAVCTVCGWDIELFGPDLGSFRFDLATHFCPAAPEPSTVIVSEPEDVLF